MKTQNFANGLKGYLLSMLSTNCFFLGKRIRELELEVKELKESLIEKIDDEILKNEIRKFERERIKKIDRFLFNEGEKYK